MVYGPRLVFPLPSPIIALILRAMLHVKRLGKVTGISLISSGRWWSMGLGTSTRNSRGSIHGFAGHSIVRWQFLGLLPKRTCWDLIWFYTNPCFKVTVADFPLMVVAHVPPVIPMFLSRHRRMRSTNERCYFPCQRSCCQKVKTHKTGQSLRYLFISTDLCTDHVL